MKTRTITTVIAISLLAVATALPAWSQVLEDTSAQKSDQLIEQAKAEYGSARRLFEQGEMRAAEATAWHAVDLMNQIGFDHASARMLLAEIYIDAGDGAAAAEALGPSWKPRRDWKYDLLMAVAASSSEIKRADYFAGLSLTSVLISRGRFDSLIGDVRLLPTIGSNGHLTEQTGKNERRFVALTLYAADPEMKPERALRHLAEAERISPGNHVVALLAARNFVKLGRKAQAMTSIGVAAGSSNQALRDLVTVEMRKANSIPAASGV